MSILSVVRPFVDRYAPAKASIFRILREERQFSSERPKDTGLGFTMRELVINRGDFEQEELRLFAKLLTRCDLFVDVGANYGLYTCLAASMGVQTIAVEPLPGNVRRLLRNLDDNRLTRVEVFPVGVSDQIGIATMYGAAMGASLVKGWARMPENLVHRVPVLTLDAIIGNRLNGNKVIAKIDVEGFELNVLRGANKFLASKPALMIEIPLTENFPLGINANFEATFELLFEAGYQASTAESISVPVTRATIARWARTKVRDVGNHNYLFTATA
jgi:FkbM family methyltransferase